MAKEVNKRINVWINGKEVENNIKSVRAAILKTTNELAKLPAYSKEWYAKSAQLNQLKGIYADMRREISLTGKEIQNATDKTSENILNIGALSSVYTAASSALQRFTARTREYVGVFASLDDAMVNVGKYTGMSKEEVKGLNEEFRKMDTRTSIEKLNALAADAGRLGITSKEAVMDFVEAADTINLALGEDLGEDAVKNIGKMATMFGESKNMGLRAAMIATASAINTLAQSSSASEPYIMEFSSRLAGVANTTGMTQAEIMGLASTLDQNMGQVEKSATAVQKLIMGMSSNTAAYAEVAGMSVEQFRSLLENDMNQALLTVIDSLKRLNEREGVTGFSAALKNLKLTGSGIQETVMQLASHTDQLREAQTLATQAYNDGTSVVNEAAAANSSAAAEMEKQSKQIETLKAELGEELYPIYQKIIAITLQLANGTLSLVGKIKAHTEILVLLGGLFAKRITQYAVLTAKQIAHTAAKVKDIAVSKMQATQTNLATIKLAAKCIAHDLATKKIKLHTAAQEMLNIVMKKTPWGLVAAGVAALATGVAMLINKQREAKKTMDDFNEACAREQAEAGYLFAKLKNAEKGTKDYDDALKKLNEKYPEIIQKHIDEKGALRDIEQAYKDVITQIKAKIAAQLKEQKLTAATETALKKQIKTLERMRKEIIRQGGSESVAEGITEDVKEMLDAGKGYQEVAERIRQYGFNMGMGDNGPIRKDLSSLVQNYMQAARDLEKANEDAAKSFDPFIKAGTKTESEIYEIDEKIAALSRQSRLASWQDKHAIEQQIAALQKLKQEKIEAAKAGTNNSGGGGSNGGGGTIEDAAKKWADKLANFRQQQQTASLEGWAQTKQRIIDSYQAMIDEATKLGHEADAAALATERDDAIEAAGKKYLQKYTDIMLKFQQEAKKLTDGKGGDTGLERAVFGTEQEWDAKLQQLAANAAVVRRIIDDMADDDPMRDSFNNVYKQLESAYQQGLIQKTQAVTETIRQYAATTDEFVKNEQKAITQATMTEAEKQKAKIEERYALEKQRIKDTIVMLINKKTVASETDEEITEKEKAANAEIDAEIARLEKLLETIDELKGKQLNNVDTSRTASDSKDKSVWQQLAEFDWDTLADNWQEGLNLMTTALNDFYNTVASIWSSINEIQSNREQAAYDEYCDTLDDRSAALKQQLDDGIISQKYYNAQISKMEEEKEEKENKMKHDRFEREKQANIVQSIISGALSASQTLAQWGLPWGLIPMALSLAMTAAQTAVIASQANPYAKGGYVKTEQLALVGEEGQEWVASNRLLADSKTAPVIAALESYQRGNRNALDDLSAVTEPSWKNLSQSSRTVSHTFAPETRTTTTGNGGGGSEMLTELRRMNRYLSDPKNRQAVISRKVQLKYEKSEKTLKNLARL